jgi:hypothetical protein
MGEYLGTTVSFGGKLKRSDMERLEAVMLEGGDTLQDAHDDQRSCTIAGESLYGEAEPLCQFLVELGLSYRRTSDAKYEWDGDGTFYNAATDEFIEFLCSQDGEPAIPLSALRQRHAAGATLLDIINELEAPMAQLPPLEIVEG